MSESVLSLQPPYSKSKLELESNLSEILSVVASLCDVLTQHNPTKLKPSICEI